MAKNTNERPAAASSQERAPSLRAVKPFTDAEIRAARGAGMPLTLNDAIKKAGGGAGRDEILWMRSHPAEAYAMLIKDPKDEGNCFVYPGAADEDEVPCATWDNGSFYTFKRPRDGGLGDRDRIVKVVERSS